jgi:hypothetical protein
VIATIVRLVAIVIPVFFAWEMLQAPAYAGMPSDWWGSTLICGKATLGDVVLVLGLFAMGWLVFRDFYWFVPPTVGSTRRGIPRCLRWARASSPCCRRDCSL